ncbi:restriction endonuclease subunit S [Vibrio harveyi]|nr:restriction endonuclease subunit S [Vibrio harveyi]
MADINKLITDNISVWTNAVQFSSSRGRGKSKKLTLHGVKKLRDLILELAVHGKLVPQLPSEEPASMLLERLVNYKSKLVKEKLIKKTKNLPELTSEDLPFKVPESWTWCRLQDISSYIQRGKGPKYDDLGKVKVISQKCIQWSGFDIEPARFVNDESLEKYQDERYLQSNDLLWNSTGTGTVGRINVLEKVQEKTLVADSHVTVIRSLLFNPKFISIYISAPGIQARIDPEHENALVSGSTKQVELNTSSVVSLEIPLPPEEEQNRIVEKVEELMALCDQLEKQTETSIDAHQLLVEELLSTLTNSEDAQEFEQNWARIAEHFDLLFTTEHSIEQLKQTILQLAVMGKLVPQDPNDEPASKLLKRIAQEKEQLIKDKVIKKPKPLLGKQEELPQIQLPESWALCRLSELVPQFQNGASSRGDAEGEDVVVLRLADIEDWKISLANTRSIQINQMSIERYSLQKDDVLIIRVNGSADIVGRFISSEIDHEAIYCDHFIRMRFPIKCFDSKYLSLLGSSSMIRDNIEKLFISTAGQKTVNQTHIGSLCVALPPLSEQKRIVSKINSLINLCEQLKQSIQAVKKTQVDLADSIVQKALS